MPSSRRSQSSASKPNARSLMVRLDEESKSYLSQAAELRGISLSDYVRTVTVSQARREVSAAGEPHSGSDPSGAARFLERSGRAGETDQSSTEAQRGDARRIMSNVRFPEGFRLKTLQREDPRGKFRSGQEQVDDWLATKALQHQEKHLSVTKVLLDDAGAIAGYYTLATSQVDFSDLPPEIVHRLPRRQLPVALLAWLGVQVGAPRPRIGPPASGPSSPGLLCRWSDICFRRRNSRLCRRHG